MQTLWHVGIPQSKQLLESIPDQNLVHSQEAESQDMKGETKE